MNLVRIQILLCLGQLLLELGHWNASQRIQTILGRFLLFRLLGGRCRAADFPVGALVLVGGARWPRYLHRVELGWNIMGWLVAKLLWLSVLRVIHGFLCCLEIFQTPNRCPFVFKLINSSVYACVCCKFQSHSLTVLSQLHVSTLLGSIGCQSTSIVTLPSCTLIFR